MVKGKRKPLEEIKAVIEPYNNVLITGCGGCVSVCLAGGQKDHPRADVLAGQHLSDLAVGRRFGVPILILEVEYSLLSSLAKRSVA